jgi:GTP diphosphokinase / guanosine-3',5'-bis(diphosphate) 3'-diphosphatase
MSALLLEAPAQDLAALAPQLAALRPKLAYLGETHVALIEQAVLCGTAAHAGQKRKSGEPYITHPVAVAQRLAEMGMDHETIIAAILHDTIEDTPLTKADLEARFGSDVAELVDGVTKLDKVKFASRQEANAESFRKMLMAMARDLRVILIKLCDRLHNLSTIKSMSPDSRRRIARETLDIYAPIAQRLGMHQIKQELEDLSFLGLYPRRYDVLHREIDKAEDKQRVSIEAIIASMQTRFALEGLTARVRGRIKSAWGTYEKMRTEHKDLDEVTDLYGFRVIVESNGDCYRALGVLHALYKPKPGHFKDYIAIPKANGYQSLHTVLFGPTGKAIEVQIRTEEMDRVAERGVAAHWLYKTNDLSGSAIHSRAHEWLTDLLDSQRQAGSSLEFLDNLKVDLFPDEVYLFTPRGRILALPRHSTIVDFAYAVHTNVGDHAVAARVDGKLKPLKTKLKSGQTVEVVTAKSAHPSPQWLEFVATSRARTAIRHHLKKLEHEDAVRVGHRMLDQALEAIGGSLEVLDAKRLDQYLSEQRLKRLEELLADIALGNRIAQVVARQLLADGRGQTMAQVLNGEAVMQISGREGSVVSFAPCCHPLPGDPIMGFLSPGKGIVVHQISCKNSVQFKKSPERCVRLAWDAEVEGDYRVEVRVEVENRPGVLAQVAAAISDAMSNIANVEHAIKDTVASTLIFLIEVKDRKHLARVMRKIRGVAAVSAASRYAS